MYLSRLILNPFCRQVQQEIAQPYEMHRTLLQAFVGDRAAAGVLFRVDLARRTGVPTVLVQSTELPDWTFLHSHPTYLLFPAPDGKDNPSCKPWNPQFAPGQLLAFRLLANPTFKRQGKRLAWLQEKDQLRWLQRKGAQNGFRLRQVMAVPQGLRRGRKRDDHGEHLVSHFAVRFDGLLQVTDPQACRRAVERGLGPGKAFGFGLLSVAPAS